MKYLLSVAVLAISAVVSSLAAITIPPPPLACSVVTPVQGDVWVMGKTATVTWSCKTALPLEKQLPSLLMAMELGTGTPTSFNYVDTLDDADELRRVSFPFILLTKYTPGNYLVRIRSKNHGDPDPVTAEDDNKLQWSYSPIFKIVGPGGAAVTNNTATNSTSKPTGGSATSGNSTSGSSTTSSSTGTSTGTSSTGSSTSSSANNSTKGSGSSKSTAGIVNVNAGVFFSTIMAAFVAAASF